MNMGKYNSKRRKVITKGIKHKGKKYIIYTGNIYEKRLGLTL